MKTYKMEVVVQVLTITARDEDEAEAKYGAYFSNEVCPCGYENCECVDDMEDVYHITTEEKN